MSKDIENMKKGQIYEGVVSKVKFPNKGIVEFEDGENTSQCVVKNAIPGQTVRFSVNKIRNKKGEGRLLEVVKPSSIEKESPCRHFGICGGCTYLNMEYEEELKIKESQIEDLFKDVIPNFNNVFEGILGSPIQYGYRNKMEFSFGDASKDGELELGMHKRGSFYDIVTVKDCKIVDEDYRKILTATVNYFRGKETPYFHKIRHEGFLRHLMVRKAINTGEILIDLVTSSAMPKPTCCIEKGLLEDWREELLSKDMKLSGKIVGILHTVNDSLSDTIKDEGTTILYGQDYFYENLLGLKFRITPFSFFQTNSLSAEVLYSKAREYVMDSMENNGIVYDLYSGTGTIAQLLAEAADKVIGVEIVEEAVEAAKENAKLNGLDNCDFIAGDVLKVLDNIEEKPDYIILDPPRDGIHPKALRKIIDYNLDNILYISCKPTSLARDLEVLQESGYEVKRICAIDQFPWTTGIETICLLAKK